MKKWFYTLICLAIVSFSASAKLVEISCPNNGVSSMKLKVNNGLASIVHATISGINDSEASVVNELDVNDHYSVSFHNVYMNGGILLTGDVVFRNVPNSARHGRVLYRSVTLNKVIDDYEIIRMTEEEYDNCLIIQ